MPPDQGSPHCARSKGGRLLLTQRAALARLVAELRGCREQPRAHGHGLLRGLRPILRQLLVAVDIGQGDGVLPGLRTERALKPARTLLIWHLGLRRTRCALRFKCRPGSDHSGRCAYGVVCCAAAAAMKQRHCQHEFTLKLRRRGRVR